MNKIDVFIGLGSNQSTPIEQLNLAVSALKQLPELEFIAVSSYFRSAPLTCGDNAGIKQADYINAVAHIKTQLPADEILRLILNIELQLGRVRSGKRWEPRIIDLDLLLYGDQQISQPELLVPHPEMHKRAFVLYPLFELSPDLIIPGKGLLRDLISMCHDESLVTLPDK